MKALISRYPVACFFVLAYAIAWGGALVVAAQRGFQTGAIAFGDIALMFLFMLAGPSVAGITLTAVLEGREGLHALWARMKDWHFSWRWGAVAVLIVPLLSTTALLLLAAVASPIYRPADQRGGSGLRHRGGRAGRLF